jgi:hypothetical protein
MATTLRTRTVVVTSLVVALAALVASARAEERKFSVLLGVPIKTNPAFSDNLPNPNDIWDQYFDQWKDGQPELATDPIDSFAEYWYEISYGNVNVSGDVLGWVEIPWPVAPAGVTVTTGATLPYRDLNADQSLEQFEGEGFGQSQRYYIDWNGQGPDDDPAGTMPGMGVPPAPGEPFS